MLPNWWRKGLNGMGLIITWTTNKNSAAMGGSRQCETVLISSLSTEYQVPEISFAPVIQADTDSGNYSMLSMATNPPQN